MTNPTVSERVFPDRMAPSQMMASKSSDPGLHHQSMAVFCFRLRGP